MSTRELWESSDHFKCYPLDDFAKYDKDMIKLTAKKRDQLKEEQRCFEQDRENSLQAILHAAVNRSGIGTKRNCPLERM